MVASGIVPDQIIGWVSDWPSWISPILRGIGWIGGPITFWLAITPKQYQENPEDWALNAFIAAGTMAGFMLAGLSLLIAAQNFEQTSNLKETKALDSLLQAVTFSVLMWAFTSMIAMGCWIFAPVWGWRVFAGMMVTAFFEEARALWWIYAFVRRFRHNV